MVILTFNYKLYRISDDLLISEQKGHKENHQAKKVNIFIYPKQNKWASPVFKEINIKQDYLQIKNITTFEKQCKENIPKQLMKRDTPPGNFVMLSRLNKLELCGLFFTE